MSEQRSELHVLAKSAIGKRLIAYLIDLAIVLLLSVVVWALDVYVADRLVQRTFLLPWSRAQHPEPFSGGDLWLAVVSSFIGWLIFYAPGIVYGTLMESSKSQATLGKRLFGLVVVHLRNQGPISLWRALVRNVVKSPLWLLLPGLNVCTIPLYFLGNLITLLRYGRAIQDNLAGTFVVSK